MANNVNNIARVYRVTMATTAIFCLLPGLPAAYTTRQRNNGSASVA